MRKSVPRERGGAVWIAANVPESGKDNDCFFQDFPVQ